MNAFQTQPVIMQIIPELGPGGAEQGCIDIASDLVAGGESSHFVADRNNRYDNVWVRDRQEGTTTLVSYDEVGPAWCEF